MILNWLLDKRRCGKLSTISRSKDFFRKIRYCAICIEIDLPIGSHKVYTRCLFHLLQRIAQLIIRLYICRFSQMTKYHINKTVAPRSTSASSILVTMASSSSYPKRSACSASAKRSSTSRHSRSRSNSGFRARGVMSAEGNTG